MWKKERASTWREASKRVRCRITDWIGFGFHDAAGETRARQFMYERFADEVSGKGDRIDGKFRPAQASNAQGSVCLFLAHRDQSTGFTLSSRAKYPSVSVGWINTAPFSTV